MRKFGILWRPLEHSLAINTLILKVCAKLHNISINAWMRMGKKAEEIQDIEAQYHQKLDAGIFMGWGERTDVYNINAGLDDLTDAEIAATMGNRRPFPPASRISQRKRDLMKQVYEDGFRYNLRSDNDFTYNNGVDIFDDDADIDANLIMQ